MFDTGGGLRRFSCGAGTTGSFGLLLSFLVIAGFWSEESGPENHNKMLKSSDKVLIFKAHTKFHS